MKRRELEEEVMRSIDGMLEELDKPSLNGEATDLPTSLDALEEAERTWGIRSILAWQEPSQATDRFVLQAAREALQLQETVEKETKQSWWQMFFASPSFRPAMGFAVVLFVVGGVYVLQKGSLSSLGAPEFLAKKIPPMGSPQATQTTAPRPADLPHKDPNSLLDAKSRQNADVLSKSKARKKRDAQEPDVQKSSPRVSAPTMANAAQKPEPRRELSRAKMKAGALLRGRAVEKARDDSPRRGRRGAQVERRSGLGLGVKQDAYKEKRLERKRRVPSKERVGESRRKGYKKRRRLSSLRKKNRAIRKTPVSQERKNAPSPKPPANTASNEPTSPARLMPVVRKPPSRRKPGGFAARRAGAKTVQRGAGGGFAGIPPSERSLRFQKSEARVASEPPKTPRRKRAVKRAKKKSLAAYLGMGRKYEKETRKRGAVEANKQAVGKTRMRLQSTKSLYRLGRLELKRKRLPQARAAFQNYLNRLPSSKRVEAIRRIRFEYKRAGYGIKETAWLKRL